MCRRYATTCILVTTRLTSSPGRIGADSPQEYHCEIQVAGSASGFEEFLDAGLTKEAPGIAQPCHP
jgi:hypothetical protein